MSERENLVLQFLREMRSEIGPIEPVVGVRRAGVEHPSAVVFHGVVTSELEARVRRLELRLGVET